MNLRLDDNATRRREREVFLSGFVFGFVLAMLTTLIGYWAFEQAPPLPSCEAAAGQSKTP